MPCEPWRVHAAAEAGSSRVHAVTDSVPPGFTRLLGLDHLGFTRLQSQDRQGLTWLQRLDAPGLTRLQKLDPLGLTRLQGGFFWGSRGNRGWIFSGSRDCGECSSGAHAAAESGSSGVHSVSESVPLGFQAQCIDCIAGGCKHQFSSAHSQHCRVVFATPGLEMERKVVNQCKCAVLFPDTGVCDSTSTGMGKFQMRS